MQPATTTTITGCQAPFDGQDFYVVCIGSDQRLYQFFWDTGAGAWSTVDLNSTWQEKLGVTLTPPRTGVSTRSGGPVLMSAWPVYKETGYIYEYSIYYVDSDNHIQALTYNITVPEGSTPVDPDLTDRTGAPLAAVGGGIASYAWNGQGSEHVIYVGGDGNIWELYWVQWVTDPVRGGYLWEKNNLSASSGYVGDFAPKQSSSLAAIAFESEATQHVVYIARDNTIRELQYDTTNGWRGNNLTESTGASTPAPSSPIAMYSADYQNTLHVCYLGTDGQIHELWKSKGGSWQPDQAISQINNVKPASNTSIIGYACQFDKTRHVIYIDANESIQELYHDASGGWGATNLTLSAEQITPPINTASPLAGYSVEGLNQQHIWYLDNQNRIHEVAHDKGKWFALQTFG
jgi:hypothetical protein